MEFLKTGLVTLISLVGFGLADVSHILPHDGTIPSSVTPPSPPSPYSFQYSAGRYPGQIDRIHKEAGDGAGSVHGMYSYIDPKYKVRTVEYTADSNGFHPLLTNFEDTQAVPVDSEAVALAKKRHYALYERIATEHARGVQVNSPAETVSVQRAKDRHLNLFAKIAQEHAAIAAEREAEKRAFEATSIPNDVHEEEIH
ncbi:cuticle protein 16.8 [Athalia rosae]|uniref:cuticle protein 16.8 n=1 Tax=Athalia rosae TaxID=37344 RepID=UPI002033445A|nr:cuticle protein 16.8 [Athalia rosae]